MERRRGNGGERYLQDIFFSVVDTIVIMLKGGSGYGKVRGKNLSSKTDEYIIKPGLFG